MAALQAEARNLLVQWKASVDTIEAQIEFRNPIWIRSFIGGIGKSVGYFAASIQHMESTGRVRKPTWARNAAEAWSSHHMMGYQISLD